MADPLQTKILSHLQSEQYRPQPPQRLAQELDVAGEQDYHAFRSALKELMHSGRVVLGASGTIVLPSQDRRRDEFVGTYRQNRRGFGFVVPSDPTAHEDLYIPEGENNGAITGDVVKAKITSTGRRDGKAIYSGRITEIIERSQKRFVGSLAKSGGEWLVIPDGNTLTEPILAPDAASRHIKPGTKVVIELTSYPDQNARASGVITEVLGQAGEKDVDLKGVIVQHNLPGPFEQVVLDQARESLDRFDPEREREERVDLTGEMVCTIDPDDAKDYDDAISLRRLPGGTWELGVHIADVSFFVPRESPLDVEAAARGNSAYFPGHVIPMLPEILSNGVCSLQEGVPRLCKTAFIVYDDDARPVSARFENTIIKSAKRLRYTEAQAIIDRSPQIPHPDGPRGIGAYAPEVVTLLNQMNTLAKRLQKRRLRDGQIVLDLPDVDLVLDEEGKVIDAVPEDQAFTHTLIEMFMVEANEAVARLLDSIGVPFLRRTHPEPEADSAERLRQFVHVAGYKLPKQLDRKAIQSLLGTVKGRPESFAINLAVLKSLTRAEYSPEKIGHYALASENYCHFTSPIRRYADLTVHRLLDAYFEARGRAGGGGGKKRRKVRIDPDEIPSYDDLVQVGRHISFTERRADGAEKELRKVKVLELLQGHIGDDFFGVVTGITNFGIFVQMQTYLIEGVIRYENLLDDWWDVDARGGFIRGQRTGKRIGIGDVVTVRVVKIDLARRELDLAVTEVKGRKGSHEELTRPSERPVRQESEEAEEAEEGDGKKRPRKGSGKKAPPKPVKGKPPARGGGPRGGGARGGGPRASAPRGGGPRGAGARGGGPKPRQGAPGKRRR
jgi:ribonuclease R